MNSKTPDISVRLKITKLDPAAGEWHELWPHPVERRALERDVSNGRRMIVQFQLVADLLWDPEVGSNGESIGGSSWGPHVLDLDENPASALAAEAYEGRERHIGDLVGDIVAASPGTSRWEVYAAPFRLELGQDVESLLQGPLGTAPS